MQHHKPVCCNGQRTTDHGQLRKRQQQIRAAGPSGHLLIKSRQRRHCQRGFSGRLPGGLVFAEVAGMRGAKSALALVVRHGRGGFQHFSVPSARWPPHLRVSRGKWHNVRREFRQASVDFRYVRAAIRYFRKRFSYARAPFCGGGGEFRYAQQPFRYVAADFRYAAKPFRNGRARLRYVGVPPGYATAGFRYAAGRFRKANVSPALSDTTLLAILAWSEKTLSNHASERQSSHCICASRAVGMSLFAGPKKMTSNTRPRMNKIGPTVPPHPCASRFPPGSVLPDEVATSITSGV
jgi:hypothetical protein